jgi:hypothetical protein
MEFLDQIFPLGFLLPRLEQEDWGRKKIRRHQLTKTLLTLGKKNNKNQDNISTWLMLETVELKN